METETQGLWWAVVPYFMLITFSLFVTYPLCWLVGAVIKRKFPYGDVVKEGPVVLLAALCDTAVTAAPIFIAGMPAWYVAFGIVPGTILIGVVYHRYHLKEWSRMLPYLFAAASRLVLVFLALAFMWQTGFFNR